MFQRTFCATCHASSDRDLNHLCSSSNHFSYHKPISNVSQKPYIMSESRCTYPFQINQCLGTIINHHLSFACNWMEESQIFTWKPMLKDIRNSKPSEYFCINTALEPQLQRRYPHNIFLISPQKYEGKSVSNQPISFPIDQDTQDFHA